MTIIKFALWTGAAFFFAIGVFGLFVIGDAEGARCLPTESREQCEASYYSAGVFLEIILFVLAAALITIYCLMKRKGFFLPKAQHY